MRFLAGMFFANHGDGTKLHDATEHASSYLWTARVITEVLTENLFVAVRRFNARLYGYERNGKSLQASCLVFVNLLCE